MSEGKKSFFFNNLRDAIENLPDDVEEAERRNFIISGQELNPLAQLVYEFNKIKLYYTDLQGETFPFSKRDDFKRVLERLEYEISSDSVDYETTKKMIVHLDLELGIEVYFVTSLRKMLDNQIDLFDYDPAYSLDYDLLAEKYNHKGYDHTKKW